MAVACAIDATKTMDELKIAAAAIRAVVDQVMPVDLSHFDFVQMAARCHVRNQMLAIADELAPKEAQS
jgi:hypothetical protein